MHSVQHSSGTYRYIPAVSAYSAGVVAAEGHRIVAVQFKEPPVVAEGFNRLDAWLAQNALPVTALVGMELRSHEPLPLEAFQDFNQRYRELLAQRNLLEGEANPIARTNVVPVADPPAEAVLLTAFVVQPKQAPGGVDYVIAGGAENEDGRLERSAIVALHDLSSSGLARKVNNVVRQMLDRLQALGLDPASPNVVNVYTAHEIEGLPATLAERLSCVGRHGYVRWWAHPPIAEIEFEMDLRHISEWRLL